MTDVVSGPRPVETAPPAPPTAAPAPAAHPDNDAGAVRNDAARPLWWVGLPAATIGLFMVALDQSLTGIAATSIGNTLGASTIDTQWVTTVNRVGQGIAIPAAAWLCKRYGLRTMYRLSMVLYIVLSIASVFAPTLETLAVCRFLEGFPGGIVSIAAIGAIITTVPLPWIPIGVPILQAFVLCAPGFGPVVGGLLTQDDNWRSIFWVTVALAVLGLVASLGLRPKASAAPSLPPFDLAGLFCLGGAVGAYTLAASKGNDWGWTSYPVLILFLVALDLAVLFVIIERHREHPLLDMGMFKGRTYCVAILLTAIIAIEQSSPASIIPTFLRSAQGLSAADAGIVMIPQALATVAAVLCGHFLIWQWGLRTTMATGLAMLAVGDLLLSRFTVEVPRELLSTLLCWRAIGLGLAFVPILLGASSTMPAALIPDGIQFRTIIQRIVGAVMVTQLIELASHRQRQILDDQTGLLSPASQPALYAQGQSNPESLVSVWNQLKLHGLAQSYNEAFLITGGLAIVGFVLVFIPRWGVPPGSTEVVVRDGG